MRTLLIIAIVARLGTTAVPQAFPWDIFKARRGGGA